MRVRRSLNSVQIQQDQRLLVLWNVFRVLVLRFHVIGIDCRDKLRHSFFVLVHTCIPLHRSIWIDWLTWIDMSEDVQGVIGVVLDFQILQIRILDFRFLQIQQFSVVDDSGFKICRQNFRVSHHSTSVNRLKKHLIQNLRCRGPDLSKCVWRSSHQLGRKETGSQHV